MILTSIYCLFAVSASLTIHNSPSLAKRGLFSLKKPGPDTAKAAQNALKPGIMGKAKALFTGNPNPKVVGKIDQNSTAVKDGKGQLFTYNNLNKIGSGTQGTVYDAKNHSDPNTPTVMKVGQPNTWGVPVKSIHTEAQKQVDQENRFNEKMGLSAGKPVTVTKGSNTTTYLPMKKVEGNTLKDELRRGRDDPNYISSHKLLNNTITAINGANKAGITHGDVFVGNVMVTKDKATLIDYGYKYFYFILFRYINNAMNSKASDRKPGDKRQDHKDLLENLQSNNVEIHPTRQNSFYKAVNKYEAKIYKRPQQA